MSDRYQDTSLIDAAIAEEISEEPTASPAYDPELSRLNIAVPRATLADLGSLLPEMPAPIPEQAKF